MNSASLDDMIKGWFVGGFKPTAFSTQACEVGVKKYKAGDNEAAHYHKIATEITLVLSGTVSMRDQTWSEGDIIVLAPGDITAFEAISDAMTVVVKVPGALDDKYVVGE